MHGKITMIIRLAATVGLLLMWGIHDRMLYSNDNSTGVQNIIDKSDSLFIAQSKPITDAEWTSIVKDLYGPTKESLRKISKQYQQQHRFNGAVLIAKDGVPVYEDYFGYADLKKQKPFDAANRFQLASVSKQFTAVATLMLQQEGKLHIDSSMTKYIPELPYQSVSIRHLLQHESGFPSYMWLIASHWEEATPPDNSDIVNMLAEHPVRLQFTPGSRFRYSNTGYTLLAAVVERVSGQTFDNYLEEKIFKPLNMAHSFAYSAARDTLKPGMVRGFRNYGNQYRRVAENLMEGALGDKNIYSTPDDLLKWMTALNRGELLNDTLLKKAFTPSDKNPHKINRYGMGFRIQDNEYTEKMVYHNGSWSGFRTTLRSIPEEDLTVLILSNNSFRRTGRMARNLTSAIKQDYHANSVYDIASSFARDDNEKKDVMLSQKDADDYRKLQTAMNSINREWMAHEIGKYADKLEQQSFEWYAMNELTK
ncbi:MAG: serine hydrolase domain-containing protein [Bacteroidota bacterium]